MSTTESLRFVHRYRPPAPPEHEEGEGEGEGEGGPANGVTILALHGTGGDESDLIPLARHVAPGAGILSPRGPVLEHGMPRFFRRLAEGVFDEPDLIARAAALAAFVHDAAAAYRFDPQAVVALGFSNGANIAGALLLLHPHVLRGAALIRPMVPITPASLPSLHGVRVLLSAGLSDSMVPRENPERLAALLRSSGASVEMEWQPAGHALAPHEAEAIRQWMAITVDDIRSTRQAGATGAGAAVRSLVRGTRRDGRLSWGSLSADPTPKGARPYFRSSRSPPP